MRQGAELADLVESKFTFILDLSRWRRSLEVLLVCAFVCLIGNQTLDVNQGCGERVESISKFVGCAAGLEP